MSIPTLFGIAAIVVILVLGIFLFSRSSPSAVQPQTVSPDQLQVINITANSAAIAWTTASPSLGSVIYSRDQALNSLQKDVRDLPKASPHQVHLVTLDNLKPETVYNFKIRNGAVEYPDQALQFKTLSGATALKSIPPLIGGVVNPDLKPTDEAIVLLELPDNQKLATLTTTAGNFILPIKANLTNDQFSSNLIVYDSKLKSVVKVEVPSKDPLPPIVLGQDSDLTVNLASLPNDSSVSASPAPNYDLNGDHKINSLDQAVIQESLGKTVNDKGFNPKADLNNDGLISQDDLDLLNQQIK